MRLLIGLERTEDNMKDYHHFHILYRTFITTVIFIMSFVLIFYGVFFATTTEHSQGATLTGLVLFGTGTYLLKCYFW